MNATWPLARLVIGSEGISVESSARPLKPFLRAFGLAPLHFSWDEIESVSAYRGLFPRVLLSHGVAIVVEGRRMIWWSPSEVDASEIVAEIDAIAPERAMPWESDRAEGKSH